MRKKGEDKKGNSKKTWGLVVYILLLTVWAFCSVVVSQLVVGIIMSLFVDAETLNTPLFSGLYSFLSYGLALLLLVLVPPKVAEKWKKEKQKSAETSREELGLSSFPTWTDIGLAPVAFIVSTLLAIGLVQLFSVFPWFNSAQEQATGFSPFMSYGDKIIAFLVLVVAAPIVEEIIFRGWLYGKLRARLNAVASILIVSVLFGIMHFQWNVGVNVFALSVVCCVLREITGTIYAGILTHMIKNGVAFYLLYVLGFG